MARRDALAPERRVAGSAAIAERCDGIIGRIKPGCLAVYLPIRSEVDPGAIIAATHAAGIDLVLPAVTGPTSMVFRRYHLGDAMIAGSLGTRAPSVLAPVAEPDLILLPMVGFDRSGARLGHGRGFYDRAIGAIHARGRRPPLVGLAFSVQEVPPIPHEPHDIRLDWIVSETEILDFTRKNA
jgi:5-formyltetrahydrofolate cyclo-ligase